MRDLITFEGDGSRSVSELWDAGNSVALVVVSGFAEIAQDSGAAMTVAAGQAVVLPGESGPNAFLHSGEGVLFCDAELDALAVLPAVLLSIDDFAMDLVRRVLLAKDKSTDHRRAAMRLLCHQLAESSQVGASVDPVASDAAAMLSWLEQHLDERLTLESLALRFGCSRTTVLNRFRKHFGRSPMRTVADKRIVLARQALEQTDRSVTDIARSVGYLDQPSFTRFIKTETGHSPSELRRRAHWVV